MGPSRGNGATCTIHIYEDSEGSECDSNIPEAQNPALSRSNSSRYSEHTKEEWCDGSETEAVNEAEDDYEDKFGSVKELGPVRSIENPLHPVFEAEDKVGRHCSSATQIRTRGANSGLDDPFVDEVDGFGLRNVQKWYLDAAAECDLDEKQDHDCEAGETNNEDHEGTNPDDFRLSHYNETTNVDWRHVSDISAMPEELPLPEAPSPPIWTQRGFRRATESPDSLPRSNRLLSSRQSRDARRFSPSTSNAKDGRFASSPLARKSPTSASARNSSWMREERMSSPSPPPPPSFTHSPRSARQRRLEATNRSSRDGTPLRHQQLRNPSNAASDVEGSPTPSKHPNPNKEYPLVLLHCSFSSPPLPYSPSVLRAALPGQAQESLTLLKEKLGVTVLERGILISHPGEDYELLEERILENLELKTPRVGKCGHFISSRKSSADVREGGGAGGDTTKPTSGASKTLEAKCETCSRHVIDHCRGCEGDDRRRWDIRVYASNGLMRAGAWSAAWREMEKVDVEISVWLDGDVRLALEREAQAEFERDGNPADQVLYEMPTEDVDVGRQQESGDAFVPPRSTHSKVESRSASTAACSRPASRHLQRKTLQHERLPLSELLFNFAKRSIFQRTELLWQILVVCLAVALFRQWQNSSATNLSPSMVHEETFHQTSVPAVVAPLQPVQVDSATSPLPTVDFSASVDSSASVDASASESKSEKNERDLCKIPACTFPLTAAEDAGMTALPADIARIVLSSATASGYQSTETSVGSAKAVDTEPAADATETEETGDAQAVIGTLLMED